MPRFVDLTSKSGTYEYKVNLDLVTRMQALKDGGTVIHFDHENTLSVQQGMDAIVLMAGKITD
jgi:hypothetical protein